MICKNRQNLHSSHVIANHILVSFHIAFISSLLNIPPDLFGPHVLKFVFVSHETLISALFLWISFHSGVAIHEMGHYIRAVNLNALKDSLLPDAKKNMSKGFFGRVIWYISMFFRIPYGGFKGVKKEGLIYYPEAPFNLSVAAAGPLSSKRLASIMLPIAVVLLIIGLNFHNYLVIYFGRLSLGLGGVGLFDFLLADPGKLKEYIQREKAAEEKAKKVKKTEEDSLAKLERIKNFMKVNRIQEIDMPDGEKLRAPWQFRNCGMGGRHTEKEYPESNISFQEMMFLPLYVKNYEEAQMITVALQTRLKEIIEKEGGARVMGIGLEGGLAPYITKASQDVIPEQRMWSLAVQAIKDVGHTPGDEIAIAFDPAVSELSNAYRIEFKQKDSIGMYYFWRGEEKVLMSRDQLLELYKKALTTFPIVSLEDAFAEDDYEGWRLLLKELGDKVFVIGDDLVTTKDSTIEECADNKLINTVLIKANQIGTLSETILAILVAFGKGLDVVVSHRSKSPNDDMEAQIALAANALGLKAGGGANTERLFKYGAVTKIMNDMEKFAKQTTEGKEEQSVSFESLINDLIITDVIAYEEPTNAGIPTVGVEVYGGIKNFKKYRKVAKLTGSTPLGTSAGMDEAIHLIDSTIERCKATDTYPDFFTELPDKTYLFKKEITEEEIKRKNDADLTVLWEKASRYEGKGCKNAVSNVLNTIGENFVGIKVSDLKSIIDVDKRLLLLERDSAIKRNKIHDDAPEDKLISIMQRKGNLGMNAILSMSLALARLIAYTQGKDLWQLLREEMKETMAKTIAKSGGLALLSDCISNEKIEKLKAAKNGSWEALKEELNLEELKEGLQKVNDTLKKEDKKLYRLLREQMPIYS